jgi:ferredoxin
MNLTGCPMTPDSPDTDRNGPTELNREVRELPLKHLSVRQLIALDACTRCGECLTWCPVYDQDAKEAIVPRRKVIDFLNNQEIDQVADSVLYAASREVMEDILDDKKDLLKTLSMCGNYFNAIAPAHPFTLAYAALHNNINRRINKMKQMGKLAAFVDELLAMPNEPWPAAKQRKIKSLTEELINTIIYE